MELDEEELKATRILNGADKSINRLNMSEEEKKAIEGLKKIKKLELTFTSYFFCNGKVTLGEEDKTIIDTILNLIEKEQKELQQKEEIIKTSIIPSYEETIMENEKQLFKMQEELKEAIHNEKILTETQTNYKWEQIIKDKIEEIKWKPISEYSRETYDWVLVKYFDNEYECIPDVAELRIDGKWYNRSDIEIPFEIKYFFDMQVIKGE